MRLTELPIAFIDQVFRKWRRRVIVGAIALVCSIAALIEGVAAARYALEPMFGPAGAHAAIAGAFILVIVIAFVVLALAERKPAAEREREKDEADRRGERTELIAEAIDLGYTLAQSLREKPRAPRRKRRASAEAEASGNDETRAAEG
ncbi:MAG: hypothetical protein AB7O60_10010 [Variibacter sp.]